MSAYDKLQNEGGEGYVDYAKRYPEQPTEAEQAAMLAKTKAEFASIWTADVTASRRAAWNDEAAKAGFDPHAAQKKLGFTMADLRRAVAIYK